MAASDGARLALDEAARDLARGVHPLLEVDGEREEVEARAGLRPVGGAEHQGVAVANGDGATGQTGHAAGLDGQRPTTELRLERVRHGYVNLLPWRRDRPAARWPAVDARHDGTPDVFRGPVGSV